MSEDATILYIGRYTKPNETLFGECDALKFGITSDLNRRMGEYTQQQTGSSENQKLTWVCWAHVTFNDAKMVETEFGEEMSRQGYRASLSRELVVNTNIDKHIVQYLSYLFNHPKRTGDLFVHPQVIKLISKREHTKSHLQMKADRKALIASGNNIGDEKYTKYDDIEMEIECYDISVWKDKVVFCNCNDSITHSSWRANNIPLHRISAFSQYFVDNFERLQLKELICLHYAGEYDLFGGGRDAYIFRKTGKNTETRLPLIGNGGFDTKEAIDILNNEADIVVTNPPFSKLKEFIRLFTRNNKDFLFIAPSTRLLNGGLFDLMVNKRGGPGFNYVDVYDIPTEAVIEGESNRAEGVWFTSLPIVKEKRLRQLLFKPLMDIDSDSKSYDDNSVLILDGNCAPTDYDKPFAVTKGLLCNGILDRGRGFKLVSDRKEDVIYNPTMTDEDGNQTNKFGRVMIVRDHSVKSSDLAAMSILEDTPKIEKAACNRNDWKNYIIYKEPKHVTTTTSGTLDQF